MSDSQPVRRPKVGTPSRPVVNLSLNVRCSSEGDGSQRWN